MIKGISRRVIVVDSPDPKLFEQAIFILRNDAFSQEGVTAEQLLSEACRIASGYGKSARRPLWQRVPVWCWLALSALAAALVWCGWFFL